MKENDYIIKQPDGSITLCCRKTNRCPTLIQESNDKFKIIDDFENTAFFSRKRLEESISQIHAQESLDSKFFHNEEFICLEGQVFSESDDTPFEDDLIESHERSLKLKMDKVLLTRTHIDSLETALKTFDE